MTKKIAIIGSGFSGITAAAYCAKAGDEVHVFEKNDRLGGRARQFKTDNGYVFDMGPSWYWMPDVIDKFFTDFNDLRSNYFELLQLNPQFEMVFADGGLHIPASFEELRTLCETLEKGGAKQLDAFMKEAQEKYEISMNQFIYKPSLSWTEFASITIAKSAFKLQILTSFKKHIRQFFTHPKLIALMEFPVLFLGAMPEDIPAMYSLMNYGGYKLGTWYPEGGFASLVDAMVKVAKKQGAHFHLQTNVEQIVTAQGKATHVKVNGDLIPFDVVISAADYHHTEQQLLKKEEQNYTSAYWDQKTFAPSCLIYYLGFDKKIPNLQHHTLFFENDLDQHADEIYKNKKWPSKPLFYACCPSKSDPIVAPEGHENVFLLMPIATGLHDTEALRETYFKEMIKRLEKHTQTQDLEKSLDYKKSYCIADFKSDYNAFEGNAYGLANTLRQTAVLKPSIRNKQIKNLFYTGQLTVPGPGVPPSIISGNIVANQVIKL